MSMTTGMFKELGIKDLETPQDSSHTPKKGRSEAVSPKQLHIARELADVTWRIAVPVLALTGLGIYADRSWGSKPWLTLLGSIVGFFIAGWLVKRQINRVTDEEDA